MKRAVILITSVGVFSILLFNCNSQQKQKLQAEQTVTKPAGEIAVIEHFPDLTEGEFELDENCFGEIVQLSGEQKITNEIFKVKGTQMLVCDSLLIVNNRNTGNMFMAFSLPDFKLIKSFGKRGRGPDEFRNPSLVQSDDKRFLCCIYERANNNMYLLNKDLSIEKAPFKLADNKFGRFVSDKQVYSFTKNDFVFVESVKGGKAIFDFSFKNDSIQSDLVHSLSFSDSYKSWASYIGDFGANKEKERLVYAYKYFKRLMFIDTKTGKIKTLTFKTDNAKKGDLHAIMSPKNITHYWGMSAQKDHVYILYSGRAPVDVVKDGQKENYYIFVEQYDWNGNPVKKYKLDKWGYFCGDEAQQKLYLASTNHAEPFFEFDLK
jgi:hypothetical protein